MLKIYNSNDLLRYFYGETSSVENADIAGLIAMDATFAEEWEQLKQDIKSLDACDFEPDPTSVKIIMEYAQQLHEPAH